MRKTLHVLVASIACALLCPACVSYTGAAHDGEVLYVTGQRGFLVSHPFVMECRPDSRRSSRMVCVDREVRMSSSAAPPSAHSSGAPAQSRPADAASASPSHRLSADDAALGAAVLRVGLDLVLAGDGSGLLEVRARNHARSCDSGNAGACIDFLAMLVADQGGLDTDEDTACNALAAFCETVNPAHAVACADALRACP